MSLLSLVALLSLSLGFILQKRKGIRQAWLGYVSRLLIYACYPALIYSSLLSNFTWETIRRLWQAPAFVFGLLLTGLVFAKTLGSFHGLQRLETKRSFVFLSIMPNYSYLPLVLAEAFLGAKGLAYVVLASLGADFFLWTLAYPQIAAPERGRFSCRRFANPPFVALIISILCVRFQESVPFPEALLELCHGLGRCTIPLSMFLLGCHLARAMPLPKRLGSLNAVKAFSHLPNSKAHGILLGWRLLALPILSGIILTFIKLPKDMSWVLLLISSMPGAIVTVVLAELEAADVDFAALQIFLGHLLWLFTGPLILILARSLFQT